MLNEQNINFKNNIKELKEKLENNAKIDSKEQEKLKIEYNKIKIEKESEKERLLNEKETLRKEKEEEIKKLEMTIKILKEKNDSLGKNFNEIFGFRKKILQNNFMKEPEDYFNLI